jgi:hypothetical protein
LRSVRKDPFCHGKSCLHHLAEEIDIKNLGKARQSFFGFYVDFFEDTLPAINRDYSPKKTVDLFDDDLPTFESGQRDPEPVLLEFLLSVNSISIFL